MYIMLLYSTHKPMFKESEESAVCNVCTWYNEYFCLTNTNMGLAGQSQCKAHFLYT